MKQVITLMFVCCLLAVLPAQVYASKVIPKNPASQAENQPKNLAGASKNALEAQQAAEAAEAATRSKADSLPAYREVKIFGGKNFINPPAIVNNQTVAKNALAAANAAAKNTATYQQALAQYKLANTTYQTIVTQYKKVQGDMDTIYYNFGLWQTSGAQVIDNNNKMNAYVRWGIANNQDTVAVHNAAIPNGYDLRSSALGRHSRFVNEFNAAWANPNINNPEHFNDLIILLGQILAEESTLNTMDPKIFNKYVSLGAPRQ